MNTNPILQALQTRDDLLAFRDRIGRAYAEFSGNPLGQRKQDAFAARVCGMKNWNTLLATVDRTPSPDDVDRYVRERFQAFAPMWGGDWYGEGFYDLFEPIGRATLVTDGGDEIDVIVGISTTVEVPCHGQPATHVALTQNLKAMDVEAGELHDLCPTTDGLRRNTQSGLGAPVQNLVLDEGFLAAMRAQEPGRFPDASSPHPAWLCAYVQIAQQLVLDRVLAALGVPFTVDFRGDPGTRLLRLAAPLSAFRGVAAA